MMLAPVDGQDDNGLGSFAEVHGVREAQDRSSDVVVDFGNGKGIGRHAIDNLLKNLTERPPEDGPTLLVPLAHAERLVLGFRPEDDLTSHASVQQFVANVRPIDGRVGVCHVGGPAAIEFASLRVSRHERSVSLRICQTVPKRHR